jgi:hypothetical protein
VCIWAPPFRLAKEMFPLSQHAVTFLFHPVGQGALTKKPVSHLTPEVSFRGDRYVLMTPQLAGVVRAELGPLAGTLVNERQTILAAMDFLPTGF